MKLNEVRYMKSLVHTLVHRKHSINVTYCSYSTIRLQLLLLLMQYIYLVKQKHFQTCDYLLMCLSLIDLTGGVVPVGLSKKGATAEFQAHPHHSPNCLGPYFKKIIYSCLYIK